MRSAMNRVAAGGLLCVLSGCAFMGMDSFEPWEVANGEYLSGLPAEQRDTFPSDWHAIAYALAVDCFSEMEPATDRDRAVQAACQLDVIGTDETVFSRIMNLDDFCSDVRANREAGVDIPDDLFC